MQHPDEGTLHGWLDGALDAGEAARVEAHVASCAVCSSAVADARGFIAASSRILSALDDVPAGAIPPARATVAAPSAAAASVRPLPRSLLARMPYARAAAAVVFLAAGTFAITRLVGPEAERAGRLTTAIPVVISPAPPAAAVVSPAVAPPAAAPAAVQSGSLSPGRKAAVARPETLGAPLSTLTDAAKPAAALSVPADSPRVASAVSPSAAIGNAGSAGSAASAPRIAAQL
nr:zf-HC2 domain-containing protein [Gemmatimonadota bacterium]